MFAEFRDWFESPSLPFICPHSQRAHSCNSPHSFGEEEVSVTLAVRLCVLVWERSARRSVVTTRGPGHPLLQKQTDRKYRKVREKSMDRAYKDACSLEPRLYRLGARGSEWDECARRGGGGDALRGPSGRPRPSLWLLYLLPIDDVDLTSRFVEPQRIDAGLLYRSARNCSVLCVSPSLHKHRSVRGQKYVKLIFFSPFFFFFFVRKRPRKKGQPRPAR